MSKLSTMWRRWQKFPKDVLKIPRHVLCRSSSSRRSSGTSRTSLRSSATWRDRETRTRVLLPAFLITASSRQMPVTRQGHARLHVTHTHSRSKNATKKISTCNHPYRGPHRRCYRRRYSNDASFTEKIYIHIVGAIRETTLRAVLSFDLDTPSGLARSLARAACTSCWQLLHGTLITSKYWPSRNMFSRSLGTLWQCSGNGGAEDSARTARRVASLPFSCWPRAGGSCRLAKPSKRREAWLTSRARARRHLALLTAHAPFGAVSAARMEWQNPSSAALWTRASLLSDESATRVLVYLLAQLAIERCLAAVPRCW